MSSLKIGERMNIYVKNTKYRNLKTLVKRCVLKLPEEPIDLHIHSSRRTSLLTLVFLVLNCRSIRSIELMQDISTLSFPIVLFANAKNSFKLQLLVSKPITKRHWKKCKLLNGVVNILDTSSCDHTPLYAQNRNIISLNPLHAGICEANIYSIVSGAPTLCCEVTSCLGKNLYISQNGDLSYCYKNPSITIIGNVFNNEDIFDNDIFRTVLQEAMRKRVTCSQCKYVYLCKGGCVLQPECSMLKKTYDAAVEDITTIVQRNINLSTVPLYKERAALYYLLNSGELNIKTAKGGNVNV